MHDANKHNFVHMPVNGFFILCEISIFFQIFFFALFRNKWFAAVLLPFASFYSSFDCTMNKLSITGKKVEINITN